MKPLILSLAALAMPALALTDAELEGIGKRVWQNECGGTRVGLASWNDGEAFASLGIGHFIWYPDGARGPFEESFPALVRFLVGEGVKVPVWMKGPCPWNTRAEFRAAEDGAQVGALRDLLAGTVREQGRFLARRMETALPKLLAAVPKGGRAGVEGQFKRLAGSAAGTFALVDYVNFKGEGTDARERYKGAGWGLLQVIEGMTGRGPGAAREFGESAAKVLARRVKNAPPERNEGRWLAGWLVRVRAYGR